ncbi:hypothetical protein NP233_g14 [Leucocoprinus birnbaumii]|uniref:Uncharacterized protein n=1 Tax=Leucocoprinus birnbaumii TaxID=56174 RepID=A0AAD5W4L1_9AGAR|nr:hypothetical protein NP233_g14 [Leucocoprinus birnbaumii]
MSSTPIPHASLITDKVLYCIPLFYALVVSLVLQVLLDGVDFGLMMWWILRSHDEGLELLTTLIDRSIFMAIGELFAVLVGILGVYGLLYRKRFMKNFWKPQAFVWLCQFGLGIWYIAVYYRVSIDEERHDCKRETKEDSDDPGVELCQENVSFDGAPLSYVLVSFILQMIVQTLSLYFVRCWRLLLIKYGDKKQSDVEHLGQGSYRNEAFNWQSKPSHAYRNNSNASDVTLLGVMDVDKASTKSISESKPPRKF